jgi:hypothetical protein
MRRTVARLAAACALAVTFTTSAVAGNPNAPGQEKKDDAAAQQQAPQQQAVPPGQAKKSEAAPAPAPAQQPAAQPAAQPQASHTPPGQAKKTQSQSGASSSTSAQAGVKPSSTTTHWTHCRTGGSAGAATCKAEPGTPDVGTDVSKRYGNGKTAAQIAVSRGAPAGTLITGPGNSQPHKVSDCRHKSNKSGGVDVHAIKSYSTSCAPQSQPAPVAPQISVTHVCGQDIVTTKAVSVMGVLHGKHEHLMTNQHSAHFTKHADKAVVGEVESTSVVATGETCGSSSQPVITSSSTSSNVSNATTTISSSSTSSNTSSSTSSNTSSNTSSSTQSASAAPVGGVLGAHATIAKPKAKSSGGGVLGTASNVAGSSLPFTGFPVWMAALIGLGLVAAGVVFWRRGTARA